MKCINILKLRIKCLLFYFLIKVVYYVCKHEMVCVQAAQGDIRQVLNRHVWMMSIVWLHDMLLVLLLKPEQWWVS